MKTFTARPTRALTRFGAVAATLAAGVGLSLAVAAPAQAEQINNQCWGSLSSTGAWSVWCGAASPVKQYRATERCHDDFHGTTFTVYGPWKNRPNTSTSNCGTRIGILASGMQSK